MRIFIASSIKEFANRLKNRLNREGYAIDYAAPDPIHYIYITLYQECYDLIIIDCISLKDEGLHFCQFLRNKHIQSPVVIISDNATHEAVSQALDCGADDYIATPVRFQELHARIRALLRRPRHALAPSLKTGNLALNPITRQVFCGDTEIRLTLKEYCLLEYFMRNPGQVITREQLIDHAWDFNFVSFSNIVDVHVKNLRKKLQQYPAEPTLETVWGVGYRLRQ